MKVNLTIGIPAWVDKICAWPVMIYRKCKYGYTFRRIYLGEGKYTIVEPADYYRLNKFNWCAVSYGDLIYALRIARRPRKGIRIASMHREIMKAPKGLLVDHKFSNTLDNRRVNLRLATRSQNQHNRRKTKSKTSSRFTGVCLDKSCGKWRSYIRYRRKRKWLGRFKTEIEAARAYDGAAKKYYGEFARLNLPEEAPLS